MKAIKLQSGYYQFGNKGAVFNNETHIAHTGSETLCGTPMLSSNWARIEKHEEIGCPECLAIYGKPSKDEWNLMMNSMQQYEHKPIIIPERYGEYMIEYFTNVLPPIIWGNDYVLCSEPYSYDEESRSNTYTGFYCKNGIYYGVITTAINFKKLKNEVSGN